MLRRSLSYGSSQTSCPFSAVLGRSLPKPEGLLSWAFRRERLRRPTENRWKPVRTIHPFGPDRKHFLRRRPALSTLTVTIPGGVDRKDRNCHLSCLFGPDLTLNYLRHKLSHWQLSS